MMRILITNDDGITSDGIIRLAAAAAGYGQVFMVAPEKQCSAQSHSITLHKPVEIHPHDLPVEGVRAYSVKGTPADCVRVGSLNIMEGKCDIVLSGINYGYNMASDIQYSATVGAAFEAEFQGYKAIAFSEDASECHEVTDRYLKEIMEEVIKEPYVPGRIINVNFPGCALSDFRGIKRGTKVSRLAYFKDHYNVLKEFADGGMELMVEGAHVPENEEGTDYGAIITDHISIGYVRNIG